MSGGWPVVTVVLAGVAGGKVTAATGDARVGAVAAVVVVVGSWLAHSWRYPLTSCLWCKGSPRRRDEGGKNWASCWLCGGSGRRRRLGAFVLGRGFGKM